MVYRRMNFVNGIPPEYHWATKTRIGGSAGGAGIQRMMIDTWLDVIDAEKADPSGHIGPCGGNLPDPKSEAAAIVNLHLQPSHPRGGAMWGRLHQHGLPPALYRLPPLVLA